jgi:YVTN family beta-propeller protein
MWVGSIEGDSVVKVDPATNQVIGSIPVGEGPRSIVIVDNSLWVAEFEDGQDARIEPEPA